jgi:hypothetical protein
VGGGREVKRKKEMRHAQDRLAQEPALDFSLKEGQTITVNIKTVPTATTTPVHSPAPMADVLSSFSCAQSWTWYGESSPRRGRRHRTGRLLSPAAASAPPSFRPHQVSHHTIPLFFSSSFFSSVTHLGVRRVAGAKKKTPAAPTARAAAKPNEWGF